MKNQNKIAKNTLKKQPFCAIIKIMKTQDFNIQKSLILFAKIIQNEKVLNEVEQFIRVSEKKVLRGTAKILCGKSYLLNKKQPMLKLACLAAGLDNVYKKYQQIGISDEIFFDTMSDIKVWANEYFERTEKVGLDELHWLKWHFECKLFKIGRLQYQFFRYYFDKPFKLNGEKIKFGEPCINMHIQRGGKLLQEECRQSICDALEFFKRYFPKAKTHLMICDSWLLSPCNKAFMKEDSNIIKFANMFEIVDEREFAGDCIYYIFKKRYNSKLLAKNKKKLGYYYDLSNFEPQTSLQNSAKQYIMNGGKLSNAKGVLITKNV